MATCILSYGYMYTQLWLHVYSVMATCILGYGYMYTQLWLHVYSAMATCILSYGYIYTQLWLHVYSAMASCILSYGYMYTQLWLHVYSVMATCIWPVPQSRLCYTHVIYDVTYDNHIHVNYNDSYLVSFNFPSPFGSRLSGHIFARFGQKPHF